MTKTIQPIRKKWAGTLTDRKRFNRQMHHQSVDRCFNMEFGYWNENFTQWPIFVEHGITSNEEADIFFNFDIIKSLGAPFMVPPFKQEVIETQGEMNIIRNIDGLLAQVPKDGHDTIPHFLESSIKTPDDWKRIKEKRFNRESTERKIDMQQIKQAHPPTRDYPLGVWCGSMIGKVRDMLTFEGLAYACLDYPEMVEDMVETCCVLIEDYLDQVLGEIDFDFAAGWEDICFKSGPLVSLDFFRAVVLPRYKRIGQRLHKHGIDVWYTDCDGDIRHLLPMFLEAGLNTMFPLEVNGSDHPRELLEKYAPELRIMGGVDKIQLGKGQQAIKAYLDSLEPLVANGGFIPFCDHRCPPNVNPEDYLYYLDLKEEMFGI